MGWDLKRPRVETTALMGLCATRAHKPDTSSVPIAATALAKLARCEPNHLRARVLKPWATDPAASGGVVTVHTRSIRSRRFQIHDHESFIKFPGWAVTDTTVSRNALVVLAGICSRLDHHDPLKPVVATYDTLEQTVAMNRTTITGAIGELENAGVVTVTRRRGGAEHNLPNLYRIRWTNPHPNTAGEARAGATPETAEPRASATENRTYFSEPSPPRQQRHGTPTAGRVGEGFETSALQLLTERLNTTDNTRLRNENGLATLTRRLKQRNRQGWTAPELISAITDRDLSSANNLAAVLITRINDLGTPPAHQAAERAGAQRRAHLRRLQVWAAAGDETAATELAEIQ